MRRMGMGGQRDALARTGWRAGRIGRGLTAVATGTGLALGGSRAGSQAMAASKPLAGHRVAGHLPLSSFAAGQKHLRSPRRAVPVALYRNVPPGLTCG